jgi:suppressor of G2 allele of SKP1
MSGPSQLPCRTDSYQTQKCCAAVVYTRGFAIDGFEAEADSHSVTVRAEIDAEDYIKTWTFYGDIDPKSIKVDKTKVKIEIIAQKVAPMLWPQVEATVVEPPPLYEKWQGFRPKEEEEKQTGVEAFLRKCYRDADEDSRRAMMKSMQESGGTVFNPVWKEVGAKKIERFKSDEEKAKEKEEQQRREREGK